MSLSPKVIDTSGQLKFWNFIYERVEKIYFISYEKLNSK